MHLPYALLEQRLRELPSPPKDAGTVSVVVLRPETNSRVTPERGRLTPEGGLEGDRWGKRSHRGTDNQVTMMRADVAELVANGQPPELCGDNLLVLLDLSTENLPAGTRLRIGSALCEVTPLPHTGCGKFAARFGQDARDITNAAEFRDWRLRGLHVRVLEAGEVSPGDPLQVLSRP